jgi:hypothetical protein
MSYESSAVLFYGFPLAENTKAYRALIDGVPHNSPVKVDLYGDCHGEMELYVYVTITRERVELGGILALSEVDFIAPVAWDRALTDFAIAHGIPQSAYPPAWHLTAQRS